MEHLGCLDNVLFPHLWERVIACDSYNEVYNENKTRCVCVCMCACGGGIKFYQISWVTFKVVGIEAL